jgi:2-amino-4-hydroxy-6-hydroxymethyldihydropteridine diphosphokinase
MDPTAAPASPVTAFLGLGSNLGDRLETLESCVWALHETTGIAVEDVSAVYETDPWGGVEQDPYLNAVVRIRTSLAPLALLRECQATEAAYGRDRARETRWGPRTLDLDVLLYHDAVIDSPELVVPHPRLTERAFVLVPLLEVFPGGALPDGTRLTRALTALAPIEGVELYVRMADPPGSSAHIERPEGPPSPGAIPAADWVRPQGAPPGTER